MARPATKRPAVASVAGEAGDRRGVGEHFSGAEISPVARLALANLPALLLNIGLMEICCSGSAPANRVRELAMTAEARDAGGNLGAEFAVAFEAGLVAFRSSSISEEFSVEIRRACVSPARRMRRPLRLRRLLRTSGQRKNDNY